MTTKLTKEKMVCEGNLSKAQYMRENNSSGRVIYFCNFLNNVIKERIMACHADYSFCLHVHSLQNRSKPNLE